LPTPLAPTDHAHDVKSICKHFYFKIKIIFTIFTIAIYGLWLSIFYSFPSLSTMASGRISS
jgi:hypothetical protein